VSDVQLVEPQADFVQGMDLQTLAEARFVVDQTPQFRFQGMSQGFGEGGEQDRDILD
jgi:hypothetical protein